MTVLSSPQQRTSEFGGRLVTFRPLRPDDKELFVRFMRSLPARDNYYLMVDVGSDQVFDYWAKKLQEGYTLGVAALENDRMIGYCSLDLSELPWTRHTGEIRMSVALENRGHGLGTALANEVLAIARERGLEKIMTRMAAGQEASQSVFESLGFHTEALLSDFVKNADGLTEDLLVMSYDAGKSWSL